MELGKGLCPQGSEYTLWAREDRYYTRSLQRRTHLSPRKESPLIGLSAGVSESATKLSPGGGTGSGKGLAETALLK